MVCPECGAGARDDANFCLNCGRTLGGASADEPADEPAGEPVDAAREPTVETPPVSRSGEASSTELELQDCPHCGAPNSQRRRRCGRCGADLQTGDVPEHARPAPRRSTGADADTGPLDEQRPRRVHPLVLILGLGVVIGASLGALAAAEVRPFAADEPVATASFDPGVYVGQPRPLDLADALASSTHAPQGQNRYGADQTIDGDLTTAWNSNGAQRPDGVGETLRLELAAPAWVSGLVIGNGYQKDDRAFVANARVRRLRVSLGDGAVYDVSVLDRQGRQVVRLPEPVLTSQLTLSVLETFSGDTYQDLAISELEVRGWPAVGRDLEFVSPGPEGPQPAG